ncbi:MAG TPA: GntR family transcriptional regulator [Polyangiaceae bacterium]|jgi:GntR family transcriptional repressor for pyruvate dehydrogenase complex|nr:GntR family transcriptional regulator [Polyangiaceae bacterium]
MPLHAIRARSLSEQVFEQLAAEIITGRYAPGSQLPAERALTVVFDVNRHVVREALKRLEQIGLVKISQGGGTKVLDFKRHAGLDLLAVMSEYARAGDDVAAIWLAVLEMRAAIAADAARLCAVRATEETKQELLALVNQMKSTSGEDELFRLDLRFWELLADGANNIAYRLALNTMTRSAEVKGALAVQWSVYELKKADYWLPVATAIASGDANGAESLTRETMRAAVDRFSASIARAATSPATPETPETRPPQPVSPARRVRAAPHPAKSR